MQTDSSRRAGGKYYYYVKKYPNARHEMRACQTCGKSFKVFDHEVRDGHGMYCSRACHHRAMVVPRTTLVCPSCNQSFEVRPCERRRARQYCSWACCNIGRRGSRGDPDYRGWDWKDARLAAFLRDNYLCQQCGASEDLMAHHIIPYPVTQDNSLANLLTVCRSCHSRIHYPDGLGRYVASQSG